MEREATIHDFVRRRIPSGLRSVIGADDVLQEIWIAAFKAADRFYPGSADALDRWLVTIARAKLISKIREARRLKRGGGLVRRDQAPARASSLFGLFSRIAAAGRSPSSERGASEAAQAVHEAIEALPSNYRQAVKLHHIEGRTHAEIADAMRKTPGAVHGMIYRGLVILRQHLGPAGRFFSDDGSKRTKSSTAN